MHFCVQTSEGKNKGRDIYILQSYKDLIKIIHYIVSRVIKRNFKDEDGNIIENKFGYFKNAIISNINKLNMNIEDLWSDEELEDLYNSNMER